MRNFKEQNINASDITGIDVSWRFDFALKWGFYTNLIYSTIWLLAGITLLPVKVTNPSGMFFFGTQIWCGCLALFAPVPALILILVPFFLFTHAGKYCSGLLLDETNGQYGTEVLRTEGEMLYRTWLGYLIIAFGGSTLILCINGGCVIYIMNANSNN